MTHLTRRHSLCSQQASNYQVKIPQFYYIEFNNREKLPEPALSSPNFFLKTHILILLLLLLFGQQRLLPAETKK